jgi:voltage-gated potassium channel
MSRLSRQIVSIFRLIESFAMTLLFHQLTAGILLILLTLALQGAGLATLINWIRPIAARGIHKLHPIRAAALVGESTMAILLVHGLVILLWAGFYRSRCFPSWEPALYFSAASYSTVGYGDVMLPSRWRFLGPLESIIGVLMCGYSVSALFAIVTRLIAPTVQPSQREGQKDVEAEYV